MKGLSIFELLAGLDEDMIAAATLPETSAAAVKPPRRRWRKGAIGDFLNNGWVAACASAVIALAVLVAIITAGQNGEKGDGRENHTLPPVPGTEESDSGADETTDAVESESEVAPETETETETETEIETETETETTYSQGLQYTLLDDGSYEVSGTGTWLGTELVIPAEINGVPVTSIGENAFQNREDLISVTIPDSVIDIGESAFHRCENLSDLTLGNGLKNIGIHAFSSCYRLEEIIIPDSVTNIGGAAFNACTNLVSVDLPDNLTTISQHLFYSCTSLHEVIIPDSVKIIEERAFGVCPALTSITIPNGVTSIRDSTFYKCRNLNSIVIPNTVTSIEYGAFYQCASLTSITLPASLTSIEFGAFRESGVVDIQVEEGNPNFVVFDGVLYNQSMTTLTYGPPNKASVLFPDGVTTIGGYAFAYSRELTSVSIPSTVTSIQEGAFAEAQSMTSVFIPNSVTSIDAYAFAKCRSLTHIYYGGSEEEWNAIDKSEAWDNATPAGWTPEPVTYTIYFNYTE